jgi:hypothetical protein
MKTRNNCENPSSEPHQNACCNILTDACDYYSSRDTVPLRPKVDSQHQELKPIPENPHTPNSKQYTETRPYARFRHPDRAELNGQGRGTFCPSPMLVFYIPPCRHSTISEWQIMRPYRLEHDNNVCLFSSLSTTDDGNVDHLRRFRIPWERPRIGAKLRKIWEDSESSDRHRIIWDNSE